MGAVQMEGQEHQERAAPAEDSPAPAPLPDAERARREAEQRDFERLRTRRVRLPEHRRGKRDGAR